MAPTPSRHGPGDNFDPDSIPVMRALIRKAHEAKLAGARAVTLWGTGTPRREFLHVDDCADACVFLMKNYSDALHFNVGSGEDISKLELAQLVCDAVGFSGEIELDQSKRDGTPRKLMSSEKIRGLGWVPQKSLPRGVEETYIWFIEHGRNG